MNRSYHSQPSVAHRDRPLVSLAHCPPKLPPAQSRPRSRVGSRTRRRPRRSTQRECGRTQARASSPWSTPPRPHTVASTRQPAHAWRPMACTSHGQRLPASRSAGQPYRAQEGEAHGRRPTANLTSAAPASDRRQETPNVLSNARATTALICSTTSPHPRLLPLSLPGRRTPPARRWLPLGSPSPRLLICLPPAFCAEPVTVPTSAETPLSLRASLAERETPAATARKPKTYLRTYADAGPASVLNLES